jgi:hypothetical protein
MKTWNTAKCVHTGHQDAWWKNIKIDVLRVFFYILNGLKKSETSA